MFVQTREVADGYAFLEAQVEVQNTTLENRLAEVTVSVFKEGEGTVFARTKRVIQINAGKEETARLSLTLAQPLLWDAEHPGTVQGKSGGSKPWCLQNSFCEGRDHGNG